MRYFLFILCSLINLGFSHATFAQGLGRYISIEPIEVNEEVTIPAGASVNVLGIIEVSAAVSSSGKLATFTYGSQVFNADAELFYQDVNSATFDVSPARTFDGGTSASVCATIYRKNSNSALEFSDKTYPNYFEVINNREIVSNYSISKQRDISSYREQNAEFCISGLAYSTTYEIKLLPGLKAKSVYEVELDQPISLKVKTPSIEPKIIVDSSKSILTSASTSIIPIEYVNVDEIKVTLHRVDLASLPSYSSVLQILDKGDISQLDNFWADKLTEKSITVKNELNKKNTVNLNFNDVISADQNGLFVATFSSPQIPTDYWDNIPTQWFAVSDLSVQIFKGLTSTNFFINSFTDTQPIKDVSVQIVAKNNRTLFEGTTDANGQLQLSNTLISGSGGFAPEFIFARSKTAGTSIIKISSLDGKPRFLDGGEIKQHSEDVYLTSDRNIYRAGDTLHSFGVIRDLQLDPITDQELNLKLSDRRDDIIEVATVFSDANGAFARNFALQTNLRPGRYTLSVEKVDETVLAQTTVSIEDFVPLTIDPTLDIPNSVWPLNQSQRIQLSAEYFSGGAPVGLNAEITTILKTVNAFRDDRFDGFTFGNKNDQTITSIADEFGQKLSDTGKISFEFLTDYDIDETKLYEVLVEGTVFDIGGRANSTEQIIPLDTGKAYLGVRSRFGKYIDRDVAPSFDVINVDRAGSPVGLSGVNYVINKVYNRYSWSYSDGWRWKRVRVGEEVAASGNVVNDVLEIKQPLSWGRHEIILTNQEGFKTTHEFYVGWGSDAKPTSEPEHLELTYSNGFLRGNAVFSGNLTIMIAGADITSTQSISIEKGEFEVPVEVNDLTDPGTHILTSLTRPITLGSEHLPQIALGKVWVPAMSENRQMDLDISAVEQTDSNSDITVSLASKTQSGSAILYLVDEGIHALTNFENKNLENHYLSERELNYGITTNFGELIKQDLALSTINVGGGDDMLSQATLTEKSDFFKTVTYASPIIKIENGKAEYTFPKTIEWEGKLRIVALAVDKSAFGFARSNVTVQDPVSIDVSLPRFVTPSDKLVGQMNVRWNSYSGPVTIFTRIGDEQRRMKLEEPIKGFQQIELPLSAKITGDVPVQVELVAGDKTYTRSYNLISRQPSYPITEMQAVKLEKRNWLGLGSVIVQPYNARLVDLSAVGSEVSANLSTSYGINLNQVTQELNRYPYGCVEQVSSKARGLLAYTAARGLNSSTEDKLQSAIDRLLDKQRNSGAFGYWSRNSYIYEVYQPYAIDTLQLLLPHAENKVRVNDAINRGLEYLYRSRFDDQEAELYAYGLLAKSGYEVTSRARYAIDNRLKEIASEINKRPANALYVPKLLNDLTLAYWVAALLNDTNRTTKLAELMEAIYQYSVEETYVERAEGTWFSGSQANKIKGTIALSASDTAHLLTDIDRNQISPIFRTLMSDTLTHLAQASYRSTKHSANLVTLQQFEKGSVEGTKVNIDGTQYTLGSTGSIELSREQLKWGFEVSHNASEPLYLSVQSIGQRIKTNALNKGYSVKKFWHDRSGQEVDLSSGKISVKQGDLFTVIVEIKRTRSGSGSDLLVTDLLPAGFEIEDATLADPTVEGVKVDYSSFRKADYTAAMDDRFIGHFQTRFRSSNQGYISYTLRAAYEGEAVIPDAVVEEMYAPEVNGRSAILQSRVEQR